jgi:hypothetical protein
LLREVNVQRARLARSIVGAAGSIVWQFLCECDAAGCAARVELALDQFDALDESTRLLAVGHAATTAPASREEALLLGDEAAALAAQAQRVALVDLNDGPLLPGSGQHMLVTHEFVDGPFDVIVTTAAVFNVAEFYESEERLLGDSRYRGGLNLLYDHSRLLLRDDSGDDARTVAAADLAVGPELRANRIAVVAPSREIFGLARMWQDLVGAPGRTVVVRSIAEAYEWLATQLLRERQPSLHL